MRFYSFELPQFCSSRVRSQLIVRLSSIDFHKVHSFDLVPEYPTCGAKPCILSESLFYKYNKLTFGASIKQEIPKHNSRKLLAYTCLNVKYLEIRLKKLRATKLVNVDKINRYRTVKNPGLRTTCIHYAASFLAVVTDGASFAEILAERNRFSADPPVRRCNIL